MLPRERLQMEYIGLRINRTGEVYLDRLRRTEMAVKLLAHYTIDAEGRRAANPTSDVAIPAKSPARIETVAGDMSEGMVYGLFHR